MASNPPGECCTVGVKHEGAPAGKLEVFEESASSTSRQSFGDRLPSSNVLQDELYIASPRPESAHAGVGVVLVTDVVGHRFPNAQLIADQLAANGYLTVVPDVFAGDPVPMPRPAGFDLQGWLAGKAGGTNSKPHDIAHTEPFVAGAVKFLREKHNVRRVGGVGYCFGGKYVVRGLGVAGGIDVGYVAHPSFVEEAELEAVQQPLSIAAAGAPPRLHSRSVQPLTMLPETDTIFTVEKRQKSEEILRKLKIPWQINLFSGVEHGFAVRGDPSKKDTRFAKEQAFCQAVNWFGTWLVK